METDPRLWYTHTHVITLQWKAKASQSPGTQFSERSERAYDGQPLQ